MASNAEANIAKALELKAQGNEAFKAADYKQAMVHYHQVRPARTRQQLALTTRPRDTRSHAPVAAPAPSPLRRTVQHARHGLFRRLDPAPDCRLRTRLRTHTRLEG